MVEHLLVALVLVAAMLAVIDLYREKYKIAHMRARCFLIERELETLVKEAIEECDGSQF